MKSVTLAALSLAACAAFASGSAAAKIVNSSYYVPGETVTPAPSTLDRQAVKTETRIAVNQIHQPRIEFGAGSHDTSKALRSRSEVKEEAAKYERTASHPFFSY